MPPELIESKAVENLSGKTALLFLIRFYQKAHRKRIKGKRGGGYDRYIITNNGEITFTYSEAAEFEIKSPNTFYRVIRELVEKKGFLDISEPGNWYGKQPTKFALSDRWRKYGTPDYEAKKIPRLLPKGKGFRSKLATMDSSEITTMDSSEN